MMAGRYGWHRALALSFLFAIGCSQPAPTPGVITMAIPTDRGLVMKVVPDDIMRGLELRKATSDLIASDEL